MSENSNNEDKWEFIHRMDTLAIRKQKEEIESLRAEVQRLEGNIFGWKGTVMGQDSVLKCRDEEIERLKEEVNYWRIEAQTDHDRWLRVLEENDKLRAEIKRLTAKDGKTSE